MMLEETKRDKIRIRGEQRAMHYEERIRSATDMNIPKACLREGEEDNQNKERTRETGIPNEEWIHSSRYRSTKRMECKLKEKEVQKQTK